MKEVIVTSNIRPEDVKKYRENLINWILNYPKWKTILVGTGGRYQRDERYWFLKPMLQRALRVDKVIDPKVKPPEWLLQILKETNEPEVSIFGELKKVSELPEDLRSEFDLAKYSNVRSDTPQDTIMSIYPGMINIKKELVIAGFDPNELGVQGWGQFVHLLKIGRLWSMLEITTAWDRFVPSWIQDDPKIFYEWLQKVADSPTDPVYSVSQEELDAITTKLGKEAIIADTVVIIEEGDTLGETGDGMKKKAFAANLLNVSLNWDEWESWDDFESDKVPLQSWYETTSRVSKSRESTGDVFWNQLAKLAARGAIFKEDYKNIAKKLCNETRNEAIHPDTDVVVPDGVIMTGIDTADRQDINGYNSLTDEYSTFSSEGDLSCQDEE
jgi:hypothetical protein